MYCKQCGKNIPDNVKYCPSCGATQTTQNSSVGFQPQYGGNYGQPQYGNNYNYGQPLPQVGFVDAVKSYFTHYADFSGRARRSEYWYAVLFQLLVSAVLGGIASASDGLAILTTLWSIATFVPGLAICVRRLHDVGKSGAWYLWILLPIAGGIILLVQYCKDSDAGPNQYGPSPKYR